MFFIDRQIVRLQRGYRIIKSVNRQAGAADKLFHSGTLRRGQDIVGDSDIVTEALGIADGVKELPTLRFNIKPGFGVRKTLSSKVDYAFHPFEIIRQRIRSGKVGGGGRTKTLPRLVRVDNRDLMAVAKKLAYDELPQPPGPSRDDHAHRFNVPACETNRFVPVLSTSCCR